MNFGPLNRIGGERRLNVAVSRARYEMIIFSTLRSDMIDLNRTSSIGVAGLKRFLEYAEKGTRNTPGSSLPSLSEETVSIENIIADKLRSLGYTVHTDIGCSGYKIDIGIVDPQNTSNYQLGIICDGKNYKRTKTARDREIVQNNVLKALGWNICRIWTMDWWEKPDEVIASIQEAISKGTSVSKQEEPRQEEPTWKETRSEEPIKGGQIKEVTLNEAPIKEVSLKTTPVFAKPEIISANIPQRKYNSTKVNPNKYSSKDFFATENNPILIFQIRKLIENEAPISKSLLCKKVLVEWGISRLGQRIEAHLEKIFDSLHLYRTTYDGLVFFWKDEVQCCLYSGYRPESDRDATDLPPEEIANAVRQLLADSISLPLADLVKACAQEFGFTRMGSNIDTVMQRGINKAIKKNYAKIDNEKVTIAD